MGNYDIKETLMSRDGLTSDEADEEIERMREEIEEGADPEDVLFDTGLEPDYLEDLLDGVT
jgi:hypothetical protein